MLLPIKSATINSYISTLYLNLQSTVYRTTARKLQIERDILPTRPAPKHLFPCVKLTQATDEVLNYNLTSTSSTSARSHEKYGRLRSALRLALDILDECA